jgi:hypothetical protein
MMIAWVLSLLVLLATVLGHLERLLTLEVIALSTFEQSHKQFIDAEKSLLECERNLSNVAVIENNACHIQSSGKNLWLISTKGKPSIEVAVLMDDKTHITTRLNWRQKFD